jgi:hypothetical protein
MGVLFLETTGVLLFVLLVPLKDKTKLANHYDPV